MFAYLNASRLRLSSQADSLPDAMVIVVGKEVIPRLP
jgi:hypothetical protein